MVRKLVTAKKFIKTQVGLMTWENIVYVARQKITLGDTDRIYHVLACNTITFYGGGGNSVDLIIDDYLDFVEFLHSREIVVELELDFKNFTHPDHNDFWINVVAYVDED